MPELVKIVGLKKCYGKKEVLHGIDFSIANGEILGFLGPNGAAKSTTIEILAGILPRDAGQIYFNGSALEKNKQAYKQQLGIVPQDVAIYEDLNAYENVSFFASLYGLKGRLLHERTMEALENVGLENHAKTKAKTFSGGMKRRLNIACAIAHHPKLLIMDEPTVGIDPQSRNHILNSIHQLNENGMTILYTTHYMEEVEEIATRILILDAGKIIAEGTEKSLKEKYQAKQVYHIHTNERADFIEDDLYQIEGIQKVHIEKNQILIQTINEIENLDSIISLLQEKNCKIQSITCEKTNLETIFLDLTGRSLRD